MTNCDKMTLPPGNPPGGTAWNLPLLQKALGLGEGKSARRRTERLVARHGLLPPPLDMETIAATIPGFRRRAADALMLGIRRSGGNDKSKGKTLFIRPAKTPDGGEFIFANDARGGWQWFFREGLHKTDTIFLKAALAAFAHEAGRRVLVFCAPELLPVMAALQNELPENATFTLALPAYPEIVPAPHHRLDYTPPIGAGLTHLDLLEAESIEIIRETVMEATKPVMLYSIGKDSAVMLHLALKAFSPALPPFPLLHVDTGWKFRAMYDFRDRIAIATGMELIIHRNPDGVAKNINPFDHGSAMHTAIMKTDALKQALDAGGYDAAFGGARRDEEKSRAKERIFSYRDSNHRWDARNQRPELWSLYNARVPAGASCRVFPLSNWTESDIWQYIRREDIPVPPLYFAAPRPVVERDGALIMVDDDRMPDLDIADIQIRKVRFRSLGCYPLSCAEESQADTIDKLIAALQSTRSSERAGRIIDRDRHATMEDKKREGYF